MDKSERRKKLEETMKAFNKKQKDSVLDFGVSHEESEVIPTGIKAIDDFIGGGTKRGTFSIIYGGYSVGKSTIVLQQIAHAQKEGQICCYIDLEHSFEKERAKALGVNLDELVLAEKCQNAEQALEIIRALCKEKAVDYFAIDSVQAMSPLNEQENKGKERQLVEKEIAELARTLSKFFRVVAPDVFNAQASIVMIGQVRIHGIGTFFTRAGLTGGEALKHWASQMIFMRQGQSADAPVKEFKKYFLDKDGKLRYKTEKDKIGFDCVLKLEKTKSSKSASEGEDVHVPFVFDYGFVNEVKQEEVEIKIEGTPEEKEQIEKELKEKGILEKYSTSEEPKSAYDPLKEGYTPHPVKEEGEIKPPQGGTGETKIEEPKKKRGRPTKEKK
ncbi:MAG TPA: ATPase domain-containing protein [Candidatus Paceibacterota bacterium]|nr:ATPase domain-containing protein [Candidatus Paceibacterota bacterium]